MKKIAIVTYYNAPNYGAFLQAYALYSFLVSKGYNPYFIPFINFERKLSGEGQHNFYDSLSPFIANLPVSNVKKGWDVAIYGSDEIWNIRNKGFKPCLWGYGLNASHKISYSPSIANAKLLDFLIFPYTIYALRKFDCVSVRDCRSKRIVDSFLKNKAVVTLDPTFLIDYDKFKKTNEYGDYVLVYSYGLTESQHLWIRKFANSKNCKLIYTGQQYENADYNLYPGPFNWINLFYHAKFVLTTTFHGTVFSILCNRQFFCLEASSVKVIELLNRFKLEERNINIEQNIDCIPDIDYVGLNGRKDQMIQKSMDYLITSIEMK